jgi:hypothetical protein
MRVQEAARRIEYTARASSSQTAENGPWADSNPQRSVLKLSNRIAVQSGHENILSAVVAVDFSRAWEPLLSLLCSSDRYCSRQRRHKRNPEIATEKIVPLRLMRNVACTSEIGFSLAKVINAAIRPLAYVQGHELLFGTPGLRAWSELIANE